MSRCVRVRSLCDIFHILWCGFVLCVVLLGGIHFGKGFSVAYDAQEKGIHDAQFAAIEDAFNSFDPCKAFMTRGNGLGASGGEAASSAQGDQVPPNAAQAESPGVVELLVAEDRHWVKVRDILNVMDKINKEASKQYQLMQGFKENCMSDQGRRLRTELEDTLELLAVVVLMKQS